MQITRLISGALLLQSVLGAGPRPGDVFREYSFKPQGKYHVLSFDQKALEIPESLDLEHATRAEAVLEIGNAHLGFEDMFIQLNGGQWHRIPFPELTPRRISPSRYFHQWYPTIAFALSDLKNGTGNHFQLRIGPKTYEGTVPHPAYTCVYGAVFRVYYDPAAKKHAAGRVTSPVARATLGPAVELKAAVDSGLPIRQIDFIGRYEDLNYEGDGIYDQWHYIFLGGRIAKHLASTDATNKSATWDTSWVPDQKGPMQIAARIINDQGLIYMTRPIDGLSFLRPNVSVELCKPYDVPMAFTSCQYGAYVTPGSKGEKFTVRGDPKNMLAARFAISCWNAPSNHGFTVNGQTLEGVKLEGFAGDHHLFIEPLAPLTALKAGENTFTTVPGPARSSDIHWPGVAVLIQYRK